MPITKLEFEAGDETDRNSSKSRVLDDRFTDACIPFYRTPPGRRGEKNNHENVYCNLGTSCYCWEKLIEGGAT